MKQISDEHKKKISETQKVKIAAQGGLTEEHRQHLSEAQKRRYAETARKIAIADAVEKAGRFRGDVIR